MEKIAIDPAIFEKSRFRLDKSDDTPVFIPWTWPEGWNTRRIRLKRAAEAAEKDEQ